MSHYLRDLERWERAHAGTPYRPEQPTPEPEDLEDMARLQHRIDARLHTQPAPPDTSYKPHTPSYYDGPPS